MDKLNQNKIMWIDIMKGILILLMVLGHTYVSYKEFIYLFHMAVFFAISGYCWNDKHTKNVGEIKNYIFKKLKRLYIPFVAINVVYIVLTNFFIDIGIYSNSPNFVELTENAPIKQEITNYYSAAKMLNGIVKALCFSGGAARLCGATWFLTTIFMVSVFHCVFAYVIKKKWQNDTIVFILVLCICLCWAWLADNRILTIVGAVDRFPAAYSAYLIGIIIRRTVDYHKKLRVEKDRFLYNVLVGGVSFAVLYVFYCKGFHIDMAYYKICAPIGFVFCSIAGWCLVKSVSVLVCGNKMLSGLFKFLGTRTIPILLLHTLSFKVVSYLYIIITKSDFLLLASYPIIYTTPEWFRYVYAVIGTLLPLIIYQPYRVIKKLIKNREV